MLLKTKISQALKNSYQVDIYWYLFSHLISKFQQHNLSNLIDTLIIWDNFGLLRSFVVTARPQHHVLDIVPRCVKLQASTPFWTLLAAWCNWDRVSLAPRSCKLPPSCQLSNAYSPSIYMCLLLCIQKKIQIRYADMKYLNTFIRN